MAFMNGGFIDQVSQDIKYTHKEIVEKDLCLHDLLSNLFSDHYSKRIFYSRVVHFTNLLPQLSM